MTETSQLPQDDLCTMKQHARKYRYVFIDGVFDLPHYGHYHVVKHVITTGIKHFKLPSQQRLYYRASERSLF